MTREVFGLIGLDVGFLVAGEAVLIGLGFVRGRADAVRSAGLAIVVSWAATGVVVSLALVVKIPFSAWTVAVIWLLLVAAGLAVARRLQPRPLAPWGLEAGRLRLVTIGGVGLLAVLMGGFLWRCAQPNGVLNPDVWNFWLPKAKSIFFFGGLDTGPSGFTSYDNADYPPFDPAGEAISFRFMGHADTTVLPIQHWVIAAAFLLALAALLARHVRPAVLWPSLSLIVVMPMFSSLLLGSLLADEPLAILFALAGVCGALWLLERDWRFAALAGLFLTAATLTKNEGLMLSLCLLVATAVAAGRPQLRRLAVVLLAALPPIAVFLIWKVWLSRHGVPSSNHYSFGDLFRPDFLGNRLHRLRLGLWGLLRELVSPSKTALVVPLTLAAAVLFARRRGSLLGVVALSVGLAILGYAVIYWISPIEIHFYLKSAVRVVTSPVLLCAALFPLVLAKCLDQAGQPAER